MGWCDIQRPGGSGQHGPESFPRPFIIEQWHQRGTAGVAERYEWPRPKGELQHDARGARLAQYRLLQLPDGRQRQPLRGDKVHTGVTAGVQGECVPKDVSHTVRGAGSGCLRPAMACAMPALPSLPCSNRVLWHLLHQPGIQLAKLFDGTFTLTTAQVHLG